MYVFRHDFLNIYMGYPNIYRYNYNNNMYTEMLVLDQWFSSGGSWTPQVSAEGFLGVHDLYMYAMKGKYRNAKLHAVLV